MRGELEAGPFTSSPEEMHLWCLKDNTRGGHPDRRPGKKRSAKMETSHSIKKSASAVVPSVPQTELHFCVFAK